VYISESYSEWAASFGLETKKVEKFRIQPGMLLFMGVVFVDSIIIVISGKFTMNLLYNNSGLAVANKVSSRMQS
jgi:hypothetical protein